MLRFATLFLALWALLAPLSAAAGPSLIFDAKTGDVLHAEKPMAPWFPASLTKLMTAYLTFEAIHDGRLKEDQDIVASALAHEQPMSKLGMPIGGRIKVDFALRALIVMSANDVAVMLAEAVGGSVDNFVKRMNETAFRLGMTGTRFVNPHGLPAPGQVTTARDMGLLAQAVLRDFPEYAELFGLERVKIGKRWIRSHNPVLGRFEGADGMKTGYICASGYNLVASASRGERRLIAVVLGATSGGARKEAALDLLEKGFNGGWPQPVSAKIDELSPARTYGLRPEHMGPVVCRGRYGNGGDAYEVDARQREQA
ncbi:MAG TPA: D-alanyl-D-alanine carboxypeptidase family protein [Hyphomicrobiales bacterium]|nr:D-alanyl-D-alanine carboxypeptidase family protein [Hyphomicrobiales bacterium]